MAKATPSRCTAIRANSIRHFDDGYDGDGMKQPAIAPFSLFI
ncbi:MAG: hypothetical protein ACAF41_03775 [Leptolyngbya sp. BL-A-14]